MATHYAQSSVTISGELIAHIRALHKMATERIASGATDGSHLAPFAIPAYIVAVAEVEAFVNEAFLTEFVSLTLGEGLLPADTAKKLDLRLKLVLLPHLAFGRTRSKDEQRYQDMTLLIQLRNELVHYKMGAKPPKPVGALARRGIAVSVPPEQEKLGGPHLWTDRVRTLQGIRWANDTACETVAALFNLILVERRGPITDLAANFHPITQLR